MVAKQQTLCIIYGLNEGPALSKRLRRHAEQRGFVITADAGAADVLISHSGGCFFVGEKPAKIILIANPVCGLRRSMPFVVTKKIFLDFIDCLRTRKIHLWLHKTGWNIIYMFTKFGPNLRMILAATPFRSSLPQTNAEKTFVINNQTDPWAFCVPGAAIAERPNYTYMTLPGSHDDLWIHPEKYLDIIQS